VPDNKLPPEIIKQWPEVLGDVDVQVIPIQYVEKIIVQFVDGRVWDIDVQSSIKNKPHLDIESALSELFAEYEDTIANIDFRIDTAKVKTDIKNRTHRFIKTRK